MVPPFVPSFVPVHLASFKLHCHFPRVITEAWIGHQSPVWLVGVNMVGRPGGMTLFKRGGLILEGGQVIGKGFYLFLLPSELLPWKMHITRISRQANHFPC
jgi:hypothetical protein